MTRRRQIKSRRTLHQKITFAGLIASTVLVTMGASCSMGGSGVPIWDDPGSPVRDLGHVLDAHRQAGKEIGKGAEAVGNWGSEFARGWSEADDPKPKPKKKCKPWAIMCHGSND